MFLLPSILVGLALALALGGDLRRLLAYPLRLEWAAPVALAIQVVIFSGWVSLTSTETVVLHLLSYGLLVVFALANARSMMLLPVVAGLALNTLAIAVNGGVMPVSQACRRGSGDLRLGQHERLASRDAPPMARRRLRASGQISARERLLGRRHPDRLRDDRLHRGRLAGPRVERSFDPRRLVVPLGVSSFRSLACARFVSQAGDWLTMTAVVGWMFQTTHSTTNVAVVLLVRLLPPVLGGGVAALVVDRWPKRPLLIAVEGIARRADGDGARSGRDGPDGGDARRARGLRAARVALERRQCRLSSRGCSRRSSTRRETRCWASPTTPPPLSERSAAAPSSRCSESELRSASTSRASCSPHSSTSACEFRPALSSVPPERPAASPACAISWDGAACSCSWRRSAPPRSRPGSSAPRLPRLLETRTHVGAGGYGYSMAAITLGLAIGGTAVGTLRLGSAASRWIGCGLIVMSAFLALPRARPRRTDDLPRPLFAIGIVDGPTDIVFETIVQRDAEQHVLGSLFGFAATFVRTTMIFSVALAPVLNHLFPPGEGRAGGSRVPAGGRRLRRSSPSSARAPGAARRHLPIGQTALLPDRTEARDDGYPFWCFSAAELMQ